MKRPHASDDVRERALASVDGGHRVADVAAMFRVDPSTLRAQVAVLPDATLAEHCARLQARHGVAVSVPTMGRALQRLGLTLKKRL